MQIIIVYFIVKGNFLLIITDCIPDSIKVIAKNEINRHFLEKIVTEEIMKNTKLTEILKTFSEKEIRDFEKFIASSYFRNRDVTGLFDVIKQFYPKFESENYSNKFVFEKIFPDKKYDDKKSDSLLKTLVSDLFISCKEFLIQIELKEQETFRNYFLLNQLRKRKQHKEFVRLSGEINIGKIEMDKELVYGFAEKFFLNSPLLAFYIDKGDYKNCYKVIINQNDFLFVSAILKGLIFSDQKKAAEEGYNLKTRFNITENVIRNLDIKNLISDLKKNSNDFSPFIEIYYYAKNMISGISDEESYFKFKKLMGKYKEILPHPEKYMLYGIAIAFCNQKVDNGVDIFRQEVFGIFNEMLKQGVYKYSKKDYFQPGLFRNMLIQARISGEYEWMKNLIENYSDDLNPLYKENMKYYSYGQYYYTIGEYEKALENLVRMKSDYFLYKKDLKNLQFRIYYELGYFEEAYSVLDTLKHYLATSSELSERIKQMTRNFIKFANELLKIRTSANKQNAGYLLNRITAEKNTESYIWLIEKVRGIVNTV